MNDLKLEFLDLIALYRELEEEVSGIAAVDELADPQAPVRAVVEHAGCFARIEELSSRVERISDSWKNRRLQIDEKTQAETQQLADAARYRAARLQELCGQQAEKIRSAHSRLERNLAEIGRGAQYLKVLRPPKNNYPKFIDSLH
jgi:ABC-type phosphate transport system auxiliary subunit